MRIIFLFLLIANVSIGQDTLETRKSELSINNYVKTVSNLTLDAAFDINKRVTKTAALLDKKVSIAILDASGTIILITRADWCWSTQYRSCQKKGLHCAIYKNSNACIIKECRKKSRHKKFKYTAIIVTLKRWDTNLA